MAHENYFEIEANTYYELGLREGELFGRFLREAIAVHKTERSWKTALGRARSHLGITQNSFPHLIEELQGYADGAGVAFDDLWVLNLEDELFGREVDKCTSIVTNNGRLIAHNEDWDAEAENAICVLRKTLSHATTLELFYLNTLGGNAVSINSSGFVHAINTLAHTDEQVGVPRNVIARWFSETSDPESDFQEMCRLRRSAGYHHMLASLDGRIWSIECSAKKQQLSRPNAPFVHTNHFLTELAYLEDDDKGSGTLIRYGCASSRVKRSMSVNMLKGLMSDASGTRPNGIFNEKTIARMIIDFKKMMAHIWLLREEEKGWLAYDIDFVRGIEKRRLRPCRMIK